MTLNPSPRRRALAGAGCIGLAVLLAGCGPADPEPQQDSAPRNTIPQPQFEADDSVRLPLAMVSPEGQSQAAPLDGETTPENWQSQEDGQATLQDEQAPGIPPEETPQVAQAQEIEIARTATFGCEDTVSVVQSVPMVTEDPAAAAIQFLIDDQLYSHGSPAFSNPLAGSEELSVDSVDVEDDTVLVELSGEPETSGECESWQILTQIETTARVATGATYSEVSVDGQPLAEIFGLPVDQDPLQINEVQH